MQQNVSSHKKYLHYKCEVTKLGIAATGNFLSGKRESQRDREPLCNVAELNRISGLPKKLKHPTA